MEQQTIELVWYHEPLLWTLDALDLIMLLGIGVLWSGSIWMATESIKARLLWVKPYTSKQFQILAWAPVLTSGVLSMVAFPAVLDGLGLRVKIGADLAAASFLIGIVGGLGAKGAHDLAGEIIRAALARITALVRGGSDGSGR